MAHREIADVVGAIARHWIWFLCFGILTIIAGLVITVWPGLTLLFAATVFGIYLVVSSVYRFISAFSHPREAGWVRVLFALGAVLSLIVGLYLLRHPFFGVFIMGILLGMFWITTGVIDIFVAIGYGALPGRWTTLLGGALSVIAGAIVLIDPVLTIRVLAWVFGIFLIVVGIMIAVQSFMIRGQARRRSA